MRSHKQLSKKITDGLTVKNFSCKREVLSIPDPSKEVIRCSMKLVRPLFNDEGLQKSELSDESKKRSDQKTNGCSDCNVNRCRYCNFETKNKTDLILHVSTHARVLFTRCNLNGSLKSISNQHSTKPQFECHHCHTKKTRFSSLKRHILIKHLGIEVFTCSKCSFKTNNSNYMALHARLHIISPVRKEPKSLNGAGKKAVQPEKLYNCYHCLFKASRLPELRKHIEAHLDVERFTCSKCDFKTDNKAYMRLHSRLHDRQKPNKSEDIRHDGSSPKPPLQNLRVASEGEDKPHGCPYCPSRFSSLKDLRNHMYSHSPELNAHQIANKPPENNLRLQSPPKSLAKVGSPRSRVKPPGRGPKKTSPSQVSGSQAKAAKKHPPRKAQSGKSRPVKAAKSKNVP